MSDALTAAGSLDLRTMPLRELIAQTAARTPTPGGGSIAAVVGALSAALAEMALQFTSGRKAAAPHQARIDAEIAAFHHDAAAFQQLAQSDLAAYLRLAALLKLPKVERITHPDYELAVKEAMKVPEEISQRAARVLQRLVDLLDICSPWLLSDLGVAGGYARATVDAGVYNVLVNLRLLVERDAAGLAAEHPTPAEAIRQVLSARSAEADQLYDVIRTRMMEKL